MIKLKTELVNVKSIFDVYESGLFKEKYASKGKQKLFKKYGETSKEYLRKNLFENPCVIKSEECKYLDTKDGASLRFESTIANKSVNSS